MPPSDDLDLEGETATGITPLAQPPRLRASDKAPAWLELPQGPGAPLRFPLVKDESILGRAAEADVRVDSEDVSRRHAKLVRADGRFQVSDLGSRNGVFLNGVQVETARLCEGDELALGNIVMIFHEER